MRSTALKIALIGHSTADLPPLAKSIADHGLRTLELPLAVTPFETATTNSTEHNLEKFDQNKPNIDSNKINECINFINKINLDKELGKKIITQNASDSYLDLTGHIENIDMRIKNFSTHHISEQYKDNAEKLFYLLKNNWVILKKEIFHFLNEEICNI
jgi:hypothetical protein